MKKILNIVIVLMLLLLVGCLDDETPTETEIIFSIKPVYTLTIGDDTPNYLDDIVAQIRDGMDLIEFVVIDDLSVDYYAIGTYDIYFSLLYEEKLYQREGKVVILPDPTPEVPYLIFGVPDVFEYQVGDDIPNYISEAKAALSDGTKLIDFVVVDDSLVDYDVEGTYTIEFKLTYETYNTTLTSQVIVIGLPAPIDIDLNIYYLNDFHGAILNSDNQMGLARIGNLMMDEKLNHDETTLFIAGGDMLQGQLISNYYDGASTIELLNDLDLDAFVVGNHEFDWGIDVVTQYFDQTNELQATYPLLGANVHPKDSSALVDGFEPYTIIQKSGVKIAIIGTMGYGLESSIAYARIKDYIFSDPVAATKKYAKEAREVDGADIVIAVNHHSSSYYNNQVSSFTGNETVDAIFNGHTHQAYTDRYNQKPVVQSGSSGTHVGLITLSYSTERGVYDYSMENLNTSNEVRLRTPHADIESKIEGFYEEIGPLYEPIMVSGQYASREDLTLYIGKLMQTKYNADVGLHNFGGTRDVIKNNEDLSYAKLHTISPFDNSVVLVRLTGSEIISAIGGEQAYFKDGLSKDDLSPYHSYTLALNDYIFGDRTFLREKEATFTGVTVLDLFVETVENQSNVYSQWDLSLPLMFNNQVSLFSHLYNGFVHISL